VNPRYLFLQVLRLGILPFLLWQGKLHAQNSESENFIASYLSIEPGATYSWLPGAKNFFFPYVYPYSTVSGGTPSKMYFNKLGSGFGYTAGVSAEFPIGGTNAFRFGIHYDNLSTHNTESAETNCSGIAGRSGMALIESYYKSTWTFIRADVLFRQLFFSRSFYLLFGADFSYLLSDRFDATQRIISSDNGCQYYSIPDGMPTGKTEFSVNKQTSTNLYNSLHPSIRFGCGMLIPLGNNYFLSPELQASYPLHHVYTDDAVSVFNLNPSDIPRLLHADLLLSFRYAFPVHQTTEEEKKPIQVVINLPHVEMIIPEKQKEFLLSGKVKNCNTNEPVIADLIVTNLDSNMTVANSQTSFVGFFSIHVPHNGKYSVTASTRGYLFSSALFDLSDTQKVNHDILLCPEGEKIRLLVFFDYDKSDLDPASFPELDRAARLIKETPGMTVEIDGYTDATGTDEYNNLLSEHRAKAVRNYLLSKNIDPLRITAKGYGKQNPVTTNETEAGRAENRRVEFVIIK
jgi:outer membrane protein OmpA-like peptidoglycan-associated protein